MKIFFEILKNHLCQISETPPTLQSMNKTSRFSKCSFDYLFPTRMCYIFIHMDHLWHLVYSNVMISFGNPSILSYFVIFSQNVYMPFPCQRACTWMKGVLIAWFLVTVNKIGKFQQNR